MNAVPVKMSFHGFRSFLCSPNTRMNVRVHKPKNMPSAGASVNRTDVRVFAIMIIPFSYIACQQKYRTFFREYVAIYIKLRVDL